MEQKKETIEITNNGKDAFDFARMVVNLAFGRPEHKRLSVLNGLCISVVTIIHETKNDTLEGNQKDALERLVLAWLRMGDDLCGTNFGEYIKDFPTDDILFKKNESV